MSENKMLENKEVTNVASFGNEKNKVVVELVASFGVMMNFKNTPTNYTKMDKDNLTISVVPFEYDFKKSKEYKLVYSQVLKIVVDGVEADKTEDNFDKVLNRNKNIFETILEAILKESDDMGFTIKLY